jgi:hypothetical protein
MTVSLALAVAALAAAALPASALARYDVRIGVGDQNAAMFDQPLFQQAKFKRVRYFIPYDAIHHRAELDRAKDFVRRARRAHMSVLMHISTNDLRYRRARLPSVSHYRRDVGRLVRTFRPMGVREWGVWNEENHPSQPTYKNPRRAAQFYREMRKLCRGCRIVALDVLDQRHVVRYINRFYRALSPHLRRTARTVGIHNYADVNRRRTSGTRSIIRAVRRYTHGPHFWLTETGAIVKLGRSFRCNTTRAAHRIDYMFRLLRTFRRHVDRAYVYNWFGSNCHTRMDTGLVFSARHPP